jgi:peptidoglycan/xylan/chitin deacetylase (PgdA/CDA1 family)
LRTLRFLLSVAFGLAVVLLTNISLTHAGVPVEDLLQTADRAFTASASSVSLSPTPLITVEVPILMYHDVSRMGGRGIHLSTRVFSAQMDYLQKKGYTSVSLDQIAAALRGQATLPPKSVALTFDDGWAHVYTDAVPVLQSHGFRATFFVLAAYSTGHSPTFLSWEQIRSLRAAGMWIGVHSFTHPVLSRLNTVGLRREIVDAKTEIEKNGGGPVTVFAYPYGALSPYVMQAVQDAGYVAAVAINPRSQQRSDQIYRLNRITMSNGIATARFEAYLTGKSPPPGDYTLYSPPIPLPPKQHAYERDQSSLCRQLGCE